MSVIELDEYKNGNIINKLKMEEDCPKMLLTIVNFAFSDMIQNLMHQLDLEFESKRGRPAYPRTLLLIVVLYCFSINISNYTKMEEECKKNRFLLIATCGLKPSRNSFANFLNKSDERETILIADSGYSSTENLYYLFINKINALIMPKKLSEMHNNKLRRENELPEKRKKSSKKDFIRVKNGYICPNGRFMRLIKIKPIKHRKPHKDDNLPDNCKEKWYHYQTYSCTGCPNINSCKHKTLKFKTTELNHKMTERFLDKRRNINYPQRFSRSEGINGFLKGDNGVLKLIGTTETAVNNEIQLRNTIYNLTRLINLKDTAY